MLSQLSPDAIVSDKRKAAMVGSGLSFFFRRLSEYRLVNNRENRITVKTVFQFRHI
jgi:hypothetical protein